MDNLKGAADRVAAHGITVLIEPLNKRDNPGYFLNTTAEAAAILKEVGRNNVKLQLDLYHCQITEGDLTARIRNFMCRSPASRIGMNPMTAKSISHTSCASSTRSGMMEVGCEYRPAATTHGGLVWAQRWGVQPRSQS